jgi:hypothetical protein
MRTLVTLLAFILVIGTVPVAIAQTTGPLVAEGLSLPRDHQYERYDAGKGTYAKVDVSQVPALVKQKQPIYDRTAKAWVYNSPKGLDPRYAAAAAPATAPATTAPAAKAPAAKAPAATAPAATAPAATAPVATAPAATAPSTKAPSDQWQRIHGKIESIEGSTMKFRADDGRALTVDVSRIGSSVLGGLTPGEGVTVIAHEWTGPTAVRANYVQQDSSDPARGGKAAPATAPANPPLVADGLSLPPDHQYERYNASTSAYGKVEASQVPALVKQKVPIYDRTAKAWVLNTEQKLDPRYAAATPGAAAPISTPAASAITAPVATTSLVSGLTLPRDHQYERFNPGSSTYAKVDVKQVPALVEQKVPIYDRTAKAWVLNTEQKMDPRYGTMAAAVPLSSLPAGQSLTLPKDHKYERYDLASATYMKIDVNQVPTLVQQKIPVYDRTAKTWVLDTELQVDPRYVAGAARPK